MDVKFFPHQILVLSGHQLDDLQLSSILAPTTQSKRCMQQGIEEEVEASMPSLGVLASSTHLHHSRSYQNTLFRVLMEVPLHRHDGLNHWSLVTELTVHPGDPGIGVKVPTL